MKSLLGMHWLREHPDSFDFAHIERMQYRSVKPFKPLWDNRDACANLLAVLPRDSYILARDHELSEQKQDMFADPVGTGTRHANDWADKVRSGQCHLPTDRTFFLGINEPDATTGDRNAIDLYTAAFLSRLRAHGLRGGAFNFSTGHPRTVDGTATTQADYSVFERSHRAIVEGHHIGVLHIYGTAAVPCAPGHFDRLGACTWQDVEWVVGECAADEHVIGGGKHDGYIVTFAGHLHDYCTWLDRLISGINDPRIHSYQVFSYDFSHPWSSFNVREIREALESYDWQHMRQVPALPPIPQPPEPTTVHIPAIGTGALPTTVWVRVNAANLRGGPGTEFAILEEMPQGTSLIVTGSTSTRDWYQVRKGNVSGWTLASLLNAQPVATPAADGDNWSRAWPIVLKFEGGLSLDPNDTGNYYEGRLIGTKYGVSAAVWGGQYDIPNLTQERALDIYRKHYWEAAGCESIPWPMCLIHFDTAINHGVGVAILLKARQPTPEEIYLGLRALRYFQDPKWRNFGVAWGLRVGHLDGIAKGKVNA